MFFGRGSKAKRLKEPDDDGGTVKQQSRPSLTAGPPAQHSQQQSLAKTLAEARGTLDAELTRERETALVAKERDRERRELDGSPAGADDNNLSIESEDTKTAKKLVKKDKKDKKEKKEKKKAKEAHADWVAWSEGFTETAGLVPFDGSVPPSPSPPNLVALQPGQNVMHGSMPARSISGQEWYAGGADQSPTDMDLGGQRGSRGCEGAPDSRHYAGAEGCSVDTSASVTPVHDGTGYAACCSFGVNGVNGCQVLDFAEHVNVQAQYTKGTPRGGVCSCAPPGLVHEACGSHGLGHHGDVGLCSPASFAEQGSCSQSAGGSWAEPAPPVPRMACSQSAGGSWAEPAPPVPRMACSQNGGGSWAESPVPAVAKASVDPLWNRSRAANPQPVFKSSLPVTPVKSYSEVRAKHAAKDLAWAMPPQRPQPQRQFDVLQSDFGGPTDVSRADASPPAVLLGAASGTSSFATPLDLDWIRTPTARRQTKLSSTSRRTSPQREWLETPSKRSTSEDRDRGDSLDSLLSRPLARSSFSSNSKFDLDWVLQPSAPRPQLRSFEDPLIRTTPKGAMKFGGDVSLLSPPTDWLQPVVPATSPWASSQPNPTAPRSTESAHATPWPQKPVSNPTGSAHPACQGGTPWQDTSSAFGSSPAHWQQRRRQEHACGTPSTTWQPHPQVAFEISPVLSVVEDTSLLKSEVIKIREEVEMERAQQGQNAAHLGKLERCCAELSRRLDESDCRLQTTQESHFSETIALKQQLELVVSERNDQIAKSNELRSRLENEQLRHSLETSRLAKRLVVLEKQLQVPPSPSSPRRSLEAPESRVDSRFGSVSGEWQVDANELEQFREIFHNMDEPNSGYLTAEVSKDLFERSGLPVAELGHIWTMADQDMDGRLSETEFAFAMALLLRRRGGLPLPSTLPPDLISSVVMEEEPADDDVLSFGRPSAVSWTCPEDEQDRYASIFDEIDTGSGFAGSVEVKNVLEKSQLPPAELSHVWQVADLDNDGRLTKMEFTLAMAVVARRIRGASLPDVVPHELLSSLGCETNDVDDSNDAVEAFGNEQLASEQQWAPTPDELNRYRDFFVGLDTGGSGSVGLEDAKDIFQGLQLAPHELSQVWRLADADGDGQLHLGGFVAAMALVAKRLNGASLPSTLPSELEPYVRGPSDSEATEGNADSPWHLSTEDLECYRKIFSQLDNGTGVLEAADCKEVLESSNLPQEDLSIIWELADTGGNGNLSEGEFVCAMVLAAGRRRNHPLPSELPPELARHLKVL